MRLLLRNLRWWTGAEEGAGDLRIAGTRVAELGRGLAPRRGERTLDLSGHLALPGLVNGHDHLDLDLLPRLGRPPYRGFYDWAQDIYRPRESPIRELLALELRDRLVWGGLRNLIAGATTVVHHDRYLRRGFARPFPVRVLRRYGWSHSLGYSEDIVADHRRSRGRPWMVHAAEGLDERAASEVDALDQRGLLDGRTVLVHAMALTAGQIGLLSARGCSVVWCPSSNLHLYGRTAPVDELAGRVRVALGTDSTISGSPHLLAELEIARSTGLATPRALLAMVTTEAAEIFRLEDGRGRLAPGGPADLLVIADGGGSAAEALVRSTPRDVALVTVLGRPRLAAARQSHDLALGEPAIRVDGDPKWIDTPMAALLQRLRAGLGEATLAASPLWKLFAPLERAA
ncbi:MAG: amidohydrolase family protein [Thermoanaerobaculia bacterium]|nr:amidohydrolase family protein [Thermoanaerobaculia bacterium]